MCIQLVTNIIFCVLARGEACEWTTETFMMRKATASTPAFSIQQPQHMHQIKSFPAANVEVY